MIRIFPLLAIALVMAGCGYSAGPTKRTAYADVKKIYVPMIKNQTYEPNIQAMLTDTLINRFNNDGTFETTSLADADAVLDVTLTMVERNPLRFATANSLVAQEYQLILRADFVLKNKSGRILNARSAEGITTFFVSNDLISSQRQALPLAGEKLADHIVSQIADAW
ncbi:LPS assembly lipoprotein LptE [Oscillatoria amoena NRMC-F 0135]|nr:LPS assembly lipoprotein LptE [Oscillatoria amoena NRMC-F 0135]